MDVKIEFLRSNTPGRYRQSQSATNSDSADYDGSATVVRVDNTSGEAIHTTEMDVLRTLCVLNTGEVAFEVEFPTVSYSTNTITLNPNQFCLVPNPEHSASKVIKLYAISAGDEGEATFWISGD